MNILKKFYTFSLLVIFSFGCSRTNQKPLFELLPPSRTGIFFNNKIDESLHLNPLNYFYLYNGGGVGTGDINKDGLPDLFFAGNRVPSKLYLNKGDFQFEDITEKAGIQIDNWATGINFIDINVDGHIDIYVCIADKDYTEKGENKLYVNQGDGTFKERSKDYGLNDAGYSTQSLFFDYDRDGDLDMYLLTNGIENFNHNNIRPIKKNSEGISTDRLYRNNGDLTFTNVSKEAGITIEGYGLGVGLIDANGDSWLDIYCSNDFITNDFLWINNKDGTFTEAIKDYISQSSRNGMGLEVADIDNDGYTDIVELDMLPESNKHHKTMTPAMNYNNQVLTFDMGYMPQYVRNTLQLANGDTTFSEIGRMSGIQKTDWSWAPLLADFDNDGRKDLFISNGYGRDLTDLDYANTSESFDNPFGTQEAKEKAEYEKFKGLPKIDIPNYFFKNIGESMFVDVTKDWSEGKKSMSNGAIYTDLDLDGDLDIVCNNVNSEAFVYRNNLSQENGDSAHSLRVKLEGPQNNLSGIGAEITLYHKDGIQFLVQSPARGYKSSVDPVLHFGLGDVKVVDSVKVKWPNGNESFLTEVGTNSTIAIAFQNSEQGSSKKKTDVKTIVHKIPFEKLPIRHSENSFIDYLGQPLLLKMLSREGPGTAVADINNDSTDDLVVTSALNDTTFVHLFDATGTVRKKIPLPNSWHYEDLGCLVADFNGDSRKDIYVSSGGNEFPTEIIDVKDRLYLQTKDLNFEIATDLPEVESSTATVNATDFDADGDLDLFVGTRLKPGQYPLSERSYLLRNDGGKFKNVTKKIAPDLLKPQLITSALWTDFNNDGNLDLIVVGEWMEITFLEYRDGIFTNVSDNTGLGSLNGLWNSISGADFDLDGDIDYVIGNLGLNNDFRVSEKEPMTLIAKDFDANGSIDPIVAHYVNGINYPLPPRDALISQISGMKRRFPLYADYANVTLETMFTAKELYDADRREVTCLASILLENKGNGTFTWKALPPEAQRSPVYGISIFDLNNDTYPDIILTGNRRDTETIGGFLDGANGTVLLGDGSNNFETVPKNASGFHVPTEGRSISQRIRPDTVSFITGNNNAPVLAFELEFNAKSIKLRPSDTYAIIELSDGKLYKKEFYYGSGYLSQSSRQLIVPKHTVSIRLFNSLGKQRMIYP